MYATTCVVTVGGGGAGAIKRGVVSMGSVVSVTGEVTFSEPPMILVESSSCKGMFSFVHNSCISS